jgi:hypothetical protein
VAFDPLTRRSRRCINVRDSTPDTIVLSRAAAGRSAYRDASRPWHFAGADRAALLGIDAPAGPEVTGVPLGQVADTLSEEYLERLGELAMRLDSPAWWESTAAEKQVTESAVLVTTALVARARELAAANPGLLVVCQNEMIEQLVRGIAPSVAALPHASSLTVATGRALFRAAHVRRVFATGSRFAETLAELKDAGPLTLIVTYYDRRSIDAEARYRDPYFGDLQDRLTEQGRPYAIVPILVTGTDEAWAWQSMLATGLPFVPVHSVLSTGDVVRACAAPPVDVPADAGTLGGIGIGPLLSVDAALDASNRSIWFDRLVSMMPAAIASRGIDVTRIIYPFENISWEKLFCITARASFPAARIIGYQHSSITRRKTSYFMSVPEARVAPLPDRIVTSGSAAFDLLSKVYGERVVRGGGLRYAAALGSEPLTAPDDGAVLVALSLDADQVAESLRTVVSAFADSSRRVYVKPHPAMGHTDVLRLAGLEALPAPLTFEDRTITELLPETACMVATSSTAVLESLAACVPVVVLELASAIVTGPLIEARDSARFAYGAEQLAETVAEIVSAGQRLRDENRQHWRETVSAFLDPAGPELYAALLDD